MFFLLVSNGIHLPEIENDSHLFYTHTSFVQPVW